MLRPLVIGAAVVVAGVALEALGVRGAAALALSLVTILAFALYVVPWVLKPPKLRDLAIIAGLVVAAVPIALVLDALGAPPWIALLLLAVTATGYVLVSERRTHRGGQR
ncbi:MAG TPA: hypothetical protein VGJ32_04610 [Solirubrobacteraceae bacterium]